MKKLSLLFAAIVVCVEISAATVYVATDGVDADGRGTSNAPFRTILYAVESIQPEGGIVYVDKGTYSWDGADVNSYMLTLTNATQLIGLTGDPEDVILCPTAKNTCRGVQLKHSEAGLRYLTIKDAYLKNENSTRGGGILMSAGTIEDCVVRDCNGGHWSSGGVGIYMTGGRVSRTTVSNCTIVNNTCYGAGIYANHGNALVEDCLITGCTCYKAGALYLLGRATAVNCTVVGNVGTECSGIWAVKYHVQESGRWYDHCPVVVNCAIYNNTTSADSTGHAHVWKGDDASKSFYYCASSDGIEGGVSCVTGSADFKDSVGGNYRINTTSRCFDAGVDPIEYARKFSTDYEPSTTDLDGNPRVVGVVDIGCYENQKNEIECTIEVNSESLLTPIDVTLKAIPAGISGTASYDWMVSNRVTSATTVIDGGTDAVSVWEDATPGFYDVYLTLTDDSGAHEFSKLEAIKLSPPQLFVAPAKTEGVTPTYPYDEPAKAASWFTEAVDTAEEGAVIHVARGEYVVKSTSPAAPGISIQKGISMLGADPADPDATVVRSTAGAIFQNYTYRPLYINHKDALVAHMTFANGAQDGDHGGCVRSGVDGGCVSNCVICGGNVRNTDKTGGGAYFAAGLITHCVITNNFVSDSRAKDACGIGLGVGGEGKASNCLIAHNYYNDAAPGGFALAATGNAVVENCTIVKNRLYEGYSAVKASGSAVVRNCAIAGNVLKTSGEPALEWSGSADAFIGCATDTAEPIGESCTTGSVRQLFVDFVNGDYTPTVGGGLQNHGRAATIVASGDLAGNPRMVGRNVDIGAYEQQHQLGLRLILR